MAVKSKVDPRQKEYEREKAKEWVTVTLTREGQEVEAHCRRSNRHYHKYHACYRDPASGQTVIKQVDEAEVEESLKRRVFNA